MNPVSLWFPRPLRKQRIMVHGCLSLAGVVFPDPAATVFALPMRLRVRQPLREMMTGLPEAPLFTAYVAGCEVALVGGITAPMPRCMISRAQQSLALLTLLTLPPHPFLCLRCLRTLSRVLPMCIGTPLLPLLRLLLSLRTYS